MKTTVKCLICNNEFKQLSGHLKKKHDITGDEYRKMFPGALLMSELLIYNNSGKNGSNWQGGKTTLICEQCGENYEQFEHLVAGSRFCCIKCKRLWWSNNKNESILICDNCGKEFTRQDSSINEGKHFCCLDCAKSGRIGEDAANWQGGKITVSCDWCGKEFERYKSWIGDSKNFCSHECHGKWKSKNLVGENSIQWKGGFITLVCEQCGDEYECEKCRSDVSKFCSQKCYGIAHSGEKSYMWKGGISFGEYCEKFNTSFKNKIRNNYNNICFLCGKTKEENGKNMSIHHTNYDKNCLCGNNCEFVPLCISCHAKTNYNRNYWEDLIMNYLYPNRYFMVEI